MPTIPEDSYTKCMTARLNGIVERRLGATLRSRLSGFPVVVLTGARGAGKSVLLRQLAEADGVTVVDLDDPDTRALASADPATFVSGPAPVCIDEFQHVPAILDAIKAELNQRPAPGRFVLAGSTRYEALPRAAQSLTGRATVVPAWPLSQGEVDRHHEDLVTRLLAGDAPELGPSHARTSGAEYVDRVLAGGFPMALAIPEALRTQWFADYVALMCDRDVMALSRVRQRMQLPRLLNVAETARQAGLEASTAESYTQLLESVFLLYRLPAWGTALAAKSGASPKLHFTDSGVAGQLLRITRENLARREPQALTDLGHAVETFVVNEVLKQVSWQDKPATTGHWRERGGANVDLVLERGDGSVVGIAVKAARHVRLSDASGLVTLAERLPGRWLSGVVFYTGQHAAALDQQRRIFALPIDTLWR
jgi:predicted AAA+ superfamily ATPase